MIPSGPPAWDSAPSPAVQSTHSTSSWPPRASNSGGDGYLRGTASARARSPPSDGPGRRPGSHAPSAAASPLSSGFSQPRPVRKPVPPPPISTEMLSDFAPAAARSPPLEGLKVFDPHRRVDPHHGEMVPFAVILRRAAHHMLSVLGDLMEDQRHRRSEDQKRALLEYARRMRLLLSKLVVLATWSRHSSAFVAAQSVVAKLQVEDAAFDSTSEILRSFTESLRRARYRNFDVPTSIDVLTTGQYRGLPKALRQAFCRDPVLPEQNATTLATLDEIILMRLVTMECGVPRELIEDVSIKTGTITFHVKNEFSLTLTLPGGPDPTGPWHILDMHILDPKLTVQPYQLFNLMRLGQEKLQAAIYPAQIGPGGPMDPSGHRRAVKSPLLEIYRFYHNLILRLRLEKLIMDAHRILQGGSLTGLGNVAVKDGGRCLELTYWTQSKHQASLRISLREVQQRKTVNISATPTVSCPPEPSLQPKRVPILRPPVTAEFCSTATHLVAEYVDKTEIVHSGESLQQLFARCLDYHAEQILRFLASLVVSGNDAGALGGGNTDSTAATVPVLDDSDDIDAVSGVGSKLPKFIYKQALFLPNYGLSISVHRTSGLFHVAPLERYHGKLANIENAINEDPIFLPRSLSNLATALLLDQVETSITFLGFQPSPSPSRTPTLVQTGLPVNLGPRMFLRVLHLAQSPDYHLAINSMDGNIVCWVLYWPTQVVIKEYVPNMMNVVETFTQYSNLHRIHLMLKSRRIRSFMEGLCLAIDMMSFPPGAGIVSLVKRIFVFPLDDRQMQVTFHLRYPVLDIKENSVVYTCKSVRETFRKILLTVGMLHLLAQSDAKDIARVDMKRGQVYYTLAFCQEGLEMMVECSPQDSEMDLSTVDDSPEVKTKPSVALVKAMALGLYLKGDGPYTFRVQIGEPAQYPQISEIVQDHLMRDFNMRMDHTMLAVITWIQFIQGVRHMREASTAGPGEGADQKEGAPSKPLAAAKRRKQKAGVQFPTLILKTITSAAMYLTRSVVFGLRILEDKAVVAITARNYAEFPTLVRLVGKHVNPQRGHYMLNLQGMFLLPCSPSVTLIPTFLEVLKEQYASMRVLMEAHAQLMDKAQSNQLDLQNAKIENGALHFSWSGMSFELSAVRMVSQVAPNTTAAGGLSRMEKTSLSRLLSLPLDPTLVASGSDAGATKPAPQLVPHVLEAFLVLTNLPLAVVRGIAQCGALSRRVALLFITPPADAMPAKLKKTLPAHPQNCLLLQSGSGDAATHSVALVFVLALDEPAPTATVLNRASRKVFVPLTYNWDANVVSPWDSAATHTAMPAGMDLNPNMLMAFLEQQGHDGASDNRRTIAKVLDDLRNQTFGDMTNENRLVWTVDQLLKQNLDDLA